jgi:hypothetical protein
MPFDGSTLRYRVVRNELTDTLASLGIVPVSDAILEQHKLAEIARHPASLFHRRPDLHCVLILTSFIGTILSMALLMADEPVVATVMTMTMMTLLMKFTVFQTVVRPARWVEKTLTYRRSDLHLDFCKLPTPLLGLVDRVHKAIPTAQYTIGTLYQERAVLDPYILVKHYDHASGMTTTACLGIWDGKTIIRMAQTL